MTTPVVNLEKEITQVLLDNRKDDYYPFAVISVGAKSDFKTIKNLESVLDETLYFYGGKDLNDDGPLRFYRISDPAVKNSVSFILLSKVYFDNKAPIIPVKVLAIADFEISHLKQIAEKLSTATNPVGVEVLNKGLILHTEDNIAKLNSINKDSNLLESIACTKDEDVLKGMRDGVKNKDTEELLNLVKFNDYSIVSLYGITVKREEFAEQFKASLSERILVSVYEKTGTVASSYVVSDNASKGKFLVVVLENQHEVNGHLIASAAQDVIDELKANLPNDFNNTKQIKFKSVQIIPNRVIDDYSSIALLTTKPLDFEAIQDNFARITVTPGE